MSLRLEKIFDFVNKPRLTAETFDGREIQRKGTVSSAITKARSGEGRVEGDSGFCCLFETSFTNWGDPDLEHGPGPFAPDDEIADRFKPLKDQTAFEPIDERGIWSKVKIKYGGKKEPLTLLIAGEYTDKKKREIEALFTEPGLRQYLDGVERYCRQTEAIKFQDGRIDLKHKALGNLRRVVMAVAERIAPKQRKWRLLNAEQAYTDKTLPKWVQGFDPGIFAQLGNAFPRAVDMMNFRYGDSQRFKTTPFKEPLTIYTDMVDKVSMTVVTDGVSPSIAEHAFRVSSESVRAVLSRLPATVVPKSLGVIFTNLFESKRDKFAGENTIVVQELATKDPARLKEYEDIREHELTHAILGEVFGFCNSEWLTEGFAMYIGNSKANTDALAFHDHEIKQLLTDIEKFREYQIDDGLFEYQGGLLLVDYLVSVFGMEKSLEIYAAACDPVLKKDKTSDKEVLKTVLGKTLPVDFQTFENSFLAFAKEKLEAVQAIRQQKNAEALRIRREQFSIAPRQ